MIVRPTILIVIGYVVLACACARLVYVSWRNRLQLHDVWGALLLGSWWPIIFPLMLSAWVTGRKLPTRDSR